MGFRIYYCGRYFYCFQGICVCASACTFIMCVCVFVRVHVPISKQEDKLMCYSLDCVHLFCRQGLSLWNESGVLCQHFENRVNPCQVLATSTNFGANYPGHHLRQMLASPRCMGPGCSVWICSVVHWFMGSRLSELVSFAFERLPEPLFSSSFCPPAVSPT